MRRRLLALAIVLVVAETVLADRKPEPQHDNHTPDYRAMEQKIAYLKQNAAKPHPDPKPTEITEREANAYFNEGGVKLPKGVSHVRLTSMPGTIDGHAQVDFEALTQGKSIGESPAQPVQRHSRHPRGGAGVGRERHRDHSRAIGFAGRRRGTANAPAAFCATLPDAEVSQRRHHQYVQAAVCASTVRSWRPDRCGLRRNSPAISRSCA